MKNLGKHLHANLEFRSSEECIKPSLPPSLPHLANVRIANSQARMATKRRRLRALDVGERKNKVLSQVKIDGNAVEIYGDDRGLCSCSSSRCPSG